MIGNDIVDLLDPELRRHPGSARFDTRVFTPREAARLERSADPTRTRWSLWAAKEATYKLAVKRWPGISFSPVRYEVAPDSGSVALAASLGVGAVCVSLRIDSFPDCASDCVPDHSFDYVHAIVWDGEEAPHCGVGRLAEAGSPARLSAAVREHALAALRVRLGAGAGAGALAIAKRGRVPVLQRGTAPVGLDLSLSHHGRSVAWACERAAALRGAA